MIENKLTFNQENFIATIVHDLKSPVISEIKALQILIKNKFGNLNDTQKSILESMLNSAKYMKLITEQILTFYKYNSRELILQKENVILEQVVLSTVDIVRFLLIEKNQKIEINNNIKNECANIDELEIKRLIINLLSNASLYSPENSIIVLSLYSHSDYFEIVVKDNGYGIKSCNKEKVFDEYFTLAKQQKCAGFGLGLNICKNIVKAHNGEISLISDEGIGTVVCCKIPKV